jgi:spore coat protein JC
MAKAILTQYGGPDGELAAAMRYLNQRYSMPDESGRALLTDIGTEELAHVEMIATMVKQLMEGATIEEIKAAGLDAHYAERGMDLFPTDGFGNPFTAAYMKIWQLNKKHVLYMKI